MRPELGKSGASQTQRFVKLVLLVGLFVCGVLFYIWPHISLVQLGYEKEQLYQMRNRLLDEQRFLRLKMARLTSLSVLEGRAREVGLVAPKPGQIIYVVTEPEASPRAGNGQQP